MAKTNFEVMPVRGHLEPATKEGFKNMIEQANISFAAGFTMIGIVNVGERSLGGVFVKLPQAPAPTGSLVD